MVAVVVVEPVGILENPKKPSKDKIFHPFLFPQNPKERHGENLGQFVEKNSAFFRCGNGGKIPLWKRTIWGENEGKLFFCLIFARTSVREWKRSLWKTSFLGVF